MKQDTILLVETATLDDTIHCAEKLGRCLRGGECIELVSDLGGGKTTFVRGLVKGTDSSDWVSSPSFTLNNRYRGSELTLYHYDFYRLTEPGIMAIELSDVLKDKHTVVIIEWADIVENILPSTRLRIAITATGETSRTLTFSCPTALDYLLEGLDQ